MAKNRKKPIDKSSSQQSKRKTELIKQNQMLAQKINELRATAAQLEKQAFFNLGQIKLLEQMEKEGEGASN